MTSKMQILTQNCIPLLKVIADKVLYGRVSEKTEAQRVKLEVKRCRQNGDKNGRNQPTF